MDAPLTTAEAAAQHVSWKQLQSRRWQRAARGVYVAARFRGTPMLQLASIWRRMPLGAAFSGRTAAWLHGLDLPPCSPVEVTVPADHEVSHRAGVRLRKARLEPAEIVFRHGFPVTSVVRTCADLGSARDLADAVVALDMAMNAGLITRGELIGLSRAWAGRKGVVRLRRAVSLTDDSESPMETRLRLLLIEAGLPRPTPQVTLSDAGGNPIARADLYYESHRICIEFDGGVHREQLVPDNRRQNRLVENGYTVLRFTSADLISAPERVIALVRAALSRRPEAVFARNHPAETRLMGDFARNGGVGRRAG